MVGRKAVNFFRCGENSCAFVDQPLGASCGYPTVALSARQDLGMSQRAYQVDYQCHNPENSFANFCFIVELVLSRCER